MMMMKSLSWRQHVLKNCCRRQAARLARRSTAHLLSAHCGIDQRHGSMHRDLQ